VDKFIFIIWFVIPSVAYNSPVGDLAIPNTSPKTVPLPTACCIPPNISHWYKVSPYPPWLLVKNATPVSDTAECLRVSDRLVELLLVSFDRYLCLSPKADRLTLRFITERYKNHGVVMNTDEIDEIELNVPESCP
jgi:hypothetical protein